MDETSAPMLRIEEESERQRFEERNIIREIIKDVKVDIDKRKTVHEARMGEEAARTSARKT